MRMLGLWFMLAVAGSATLKGQAADGIAARIAVAVQRQPAPVREFYGARANAPAWLANGMPTAAARELAAALDTVDRDGLDPRRYGVARIRRLFARTEPESLAILDVALTAGFLSAGRDLAEGRIRPEAIDTMWTGQRGAVDVGAALGRAVESGGAADALAGLAPPHEGYRLLRAALERYRALAASEGSPLVGRGPVLARGDSGRRVAALRARLATTGDLAEAAGHTCDAPCEAAVQRFQRRHGLLENGEVGAETRELLDAEPAHWVRVIGLNLERWRWVPRDMGTAPLMVNSAAFAATRADTTGTWESAVVVGRRDWPTPIVAGRLTGIVFAPPWNVPRDIARLEIAPEACIDSTYLARGGFRLVDSTGAPVEPDSAAWAAVGDSASGIRVIQSAGPANPLGGVKLVFANRFNVSLHATPERSLFRRSMRAVSHGCVRMERAAELAARLLADRPGWTPDSVARAIADTVERLVPVADGVMVVLGYWTAWVGEYGTMHFRPDVYGWDAKLARALAR